MLSGLLTYRNDVPQEGRIRNDPGNVETRVSTFPTLHGERAVVRNFPSSGRLARLGDLGLESGVASALDGLLSETSGAVVVSGPSGSGKTTTIYACLREIALRSGGLRNLMTLEDPVEAAVPGVSQSQINEHSGFDLAGGLKSLLRQDPEVIVVGEIRDKATAEVTLQAALTGHLVLTTFHAGSAAGAISRLAEMGLEPYVLRSGLLAILSQRLLRSLCSCSESADVSDPSVHLGMQVSKAKAAVGCARCGGTGYSGRFPIAELVMPRTPAVSKAILDRIDLDGLAKTIVESGVKTLWDKAKAAVEAGSTTPAEARRVLGFQTYAS